MRAFIRTASKFSYPFPWLNPAPSNSGWYKHFLPRYNWPRELSNSKNVYPVGFWFVPSLLNGPLTDAVPSFKRLFQLSLVLLTTDGTLQSYTSLPIAAPLKHTSSNYANPAQVGGASTVPSAGTLVLVAPSDTTAILATSRSITFTNPKFPTHC